MDTLHDTARLATSKPVQRAAVNAVLLVSSAASLLCVAAVASALFFQSFVPDQVVSTPIHLQYGSGLHPYGLVSLEKPPMKPQQDYDISVAVTMPRSPANVDRGNFMVSIYLLDGTLDASLQTSAREFANKHSDFGRSTVLFDSRRPVLVPYMDPMVSLAKRVMLLFYHMLFPSSQRMTMKIPLAERVTFSRGSTLPSSAYVEVEAGQDIQIYSAALIMTAQLRGLRWLMFHYRLPTYFAFTFFFWTFEIVFMAGAWFVWSNIGDSDDGGKPGGLQGSGGYKDEDESDHTLTFPTYGKQPALKHEPGVKPEMETEPALQDIPVGVEADDEETEDSDAERYRDDGFRDSGIGTSYSEGGSGIVRKRSLRKGE